MFSDRVMDSLKVICMAIGAFCIVLILLGIATAALGADSNEYVMMSRADFEKLIAYLRACKGHSI